MADGAILKAVKSPYLWNCLTDFDDIRHANWPHWPLTADRPLKFQFLKSIMAAAAILKITKITIFPQRFDRSYKIWYSGAKWVS